MRPYVPGRTEGNTARDSAAPLHQNSGAAHEVGSGNGLTATYGNGSNRLLQNFLTESGVSPGSSRGRNYFDNAKDEPSIASGNSMVGGQEAIRSSHENFLRQI